MLEWNVMAAWIGILAGMLLGLAAGLYFDREDWQGGYSSWRRRLARLGHISCFGVAFVNLAFAVTLWDRFGAQLPGLVQAGSIALIIAQVTMPTVCYLSAWSPQYRRAFPLPAFALVIGTGCTVAQLVIGGHS